MALPTFAYRLIGWFSTPRFNRTIPIVALELLAAESVEGASA